MHWRTWLTSLLLFVFSISVGVANDSPGKGVLAAGARLAPAQLSARFCAAPGSRVTAHAMVVTRERLLHRISAVAPSQAGAAQSGSRCFRVTLKGSVARPAIARMLMQTGTLVIADSGTKSLTPGTSVRVLGASAHSRLAARPPRLRLVFSVWPNRSGIATTGLDSMGQPFVTFGLTRRAASTWCSYTTSNVAGYAAMVLDNHLLVDPQIQSAICGGPMLVTGFQGMLRAKLVAAYINFGPLPIRFQETSTMG